MQLPEEDRAGLGLRERVFAGAELRAAAPGRLGHRPPVVGIVAVQVEPADAVLVDPAVPVVVDAFRIQQIVAVVHPHVAHQPALGVHRVHHVRALAGTDEAPHLPRVPVAVEVLGGILVQQPVAVVVNRTHGAAVGLGRELVHVRAIRIVVRAEVDHLLVEQPGDGGILAVVLDQVPGEPEHALRGGDLAGVPAALEERGGLGGMGARAAVGQVDLPDGLAAVRLTDLDPFDDLGLLGGPPLHPVVDLGRGVVVLEVHHAPFLGLDLRIVGEREHRVPVPLAGDDVDAPDGVARRLRAEAELCAGGQRGEGRQGEGGAEGEAEGAHGTEGKGKGRGHGH